MNGARAWPRLVLAWVALVCLLAVSAISSWFDLGPGNLGIALTVAVLKAGLVVIFFMRLRAAPGAVRLAVLLALLMLALLLGLSLTDARERAAVVSGRENAAGTSAGQELP